MAFKRLAVWFILVCKLPSLKERRCFHFLFTKRLEFEGASFPLRIVALLMITPKMTKLCSAKQISWCFGIKLHKIKLQFSESLADIALVFLILRVYDTAVAKQHYFNVKEGVFSWKSI